MAMASRVRGSSHAEHKVAGVAMTPRVRNYHQGHLPERRPRAKHIMLRSCKRSAGLGIQGSWYLRRSDMFSKEGAGRRWGPIPQSPQLAPRVHMGPLLQRWASCSALSPRGQTPQANRQRMPLPRRCHLISLLPGRCLQVCRFRSSLDRSSRRYKIEIKCLSAW